jgi:phosphatidylglycerophosphatase A
MIRLGQLTDTRSRLAALIATAFGAGLVPYAPGTMGTIAAVPLVYWSNAWELAPRAALWLGLTALGTWAAKTFDEVTRSGDNQSIVIDEVIGYGISAWTAGQKWEALLMAFIFFRVFDVLKPPPIRQIDLWSKKKAKAGTPSSLWWGGFGVLADDIGAGLQALILVLALQWLQYI